MAKVDAMLKAFTANVHAEEKARLAGELRYARRVSLVHKGKYDALLESAIAFAQNAEREEGTLTKSARIACEDMLLPMEADCKKYTLLFVGHAHIDMNWMWRYDETVSITLDTFRTVLNLMREHPSFTFAQSQASVYRIVEQYEPEMLDEIRARIKTGQWEVSASTWVEADRNMPSFESVARHQLYTAKYLEKLLGIDAASLNLDYEPDTFGHHQNVPEMLAEAGVKYYYHCRGEEKEVLYRWHSPSGRSILVYREPSWYLGAVETDWAEFVPEYCEKYGVTDALRVYGVGNHGGGPTRRDIELIEDMATWRIFPKVEFGTYRRFFEAMERAENIPAVCGERNFVFSGCYTTQTRIKQGNRMAEKMLYEAEALSSFADREYPAADFERGWVNVLFNQFHDIIPGSGVVDTREHAMGLYQETFAAATSAKRAACQAIARKIDTASFLHMSPEGTTSEGAGVGFGIYGFGAGQVSRGGGDTRVWHLFNALPFAKKEVVMLMLWDYQKDLSLIEIADKSGKAVAHQVLDAGFNEYWGHKYARILIEAELPACGYTTYGLRVKEDISPLLPRRLDPRIETPVELILENDRIRAEFSAETLALISLVDKETGREMVWGEADFSLVREDASRGMTAWQVGRFAERLPIGGASRVTDIVDGELCQSFTAYREFGNSKMTYTVSLKKGTPYLEYDVKADWLETGSPEKGMPHLRFDAEHADDAKEYFFDIPGGGIVREARDMDLCSQGMIATVGEGARLVLLSDSKYGFRGDGVQMGVTLIRASFDPDPYPELGQHTFKLALGVSHAQNAGALLSEAAAWNHPATVVSGTSREGTEPLEKAFLGIENKNVLLSGIKRAEDENGLIVRMIETDGQAGEVSITFARDVESCCFVTTKEDAAGAISRCGKSLSFGIKPYSAAAIRVVLA
ncbi:MAG: glycoside hydrolase family 38 C-terminal domain-containing protein [Christensenellales bacterium]|jgi:alpha-mannosidase